MKPLRLIMQNSPLTLRFGSGTSTLSHALSYVHSQPFPSLALRSRNFGSELLVRHYADFRFELPIALELDHVTRMQLCAAFHEQDFGPGRQPVLAASNVGQVIVDSPFGSSNGKIVGDTDRFVFQSYDLVGLRINPAAVALRRHNGTLL